MNFGVEVSKDEASDILEAQAHIWKYIFNFINSMSLKCAVELGIPDTIHEYGKPMSISTLATTLSINPVKVQPLNRLMRILTRSGFFSEKKLVAEDDNKEEGYVLTKVGQLILRKNPLAVTPFLLTMLNQDSNKSWNYLGCWFHNADKTAFQTAHGKTMWEFADHMPEFNERFNEAMASDSKLVASCLLNNSNGRDLGKGLFEGLNSLVDVGGGTGTMTKAIANAYPQLNCICFDLPHVIASLQGTTNMTFVGGDMFKAIPQADAILLKWLLHTLNDEDCVKIMKQCKQAIMKSGDGLGRW
ncbi:hypothetical protein Nepgr_009113 [Nepenthes gracilis]|uniref:Uncharacterized protein n=1 Tax=Nepenthes gracilis TaxID=150966 RepID=A0AAD3XJV3_NEPGR|nr:hypothetical protein Nepgr_009113 [Nepenthes gracilis]